MTQLTGRLLGHTGQWSEAMSIAENGEPLPLSAFALGNALRS